MRGRGGIFGGGEENMALGITSVGSRFFFRFSPPVTNLVTQVREAALRSMRGRQIGGHTVGSIGGDDSIGIARMEGREWVEVEVGVGERMEGEEEVRM